MKYRKYLDFRNNSLKYAQNKRMHKFIIIRITLDAVILPIIFKNSFSRRKFKWRCDIM